MSSSTTFLSLTSAMEVAAAFPGSISNKTIVITGVSPDGLGLATANALASQHPERLILTGRSPEKVQASIDILKSSYPDVVYVALMMDLSSQASVRAAAAKLNNDNDIPVINTLINNAGVMAIPNLQFSEDGIEMSFATNHVGHFLLTNLILPKIIKASETSSTPTRIINVTSFGHQFSPVRFSDINFSKTSFQVPEEERPAIEKGKMFMGQDWSNEAYVGFVSYGQSKTANVLFSVALNQKLGAKHGITSYAVHPGAVNTNINRHADPEEIERAMKQASEDGLGVSAKTPDQGANTSVLAAADPGLPPADVSQLLSTGTYLADCKLDDEQCAEFARNTTYAERLWKLSEGLVKQTFHV